MKHSAVLFVNMHKTDKKETLQFAFLYIFVYAYISVFTFT